MLFNDIKIILLIAGGRAGTDFFQSLLDNHPEISQLPGIFFYDEFWLKLKEKNEKRPENIAKVFIDDHKNFFDSRNNIRERHDKLGKDKNSFFLVNKELFIKYFVDLMKSRNLNQKNLLYCLNLAYSLASGEDLLKKKIIILHLHHINRIKVLDELDFEIIYSIRDPLANYTASVGEWLEYEGGKHLSPWSYYFHMDRILNGIKDIIKYSKKSYVFQLEKLHTENEKVMKDFCKLFKISYNQSLTQSTYHGMSWWGDALSVKYLDGVNPNFKNNIKENLFFKKDMECLETYLEVFISKYNYPVRSNGLKNPFLKYLPFKVELIIWKNTIASFNIRLIITIFLYWFKRVNLMNKKNYDNVHLPYSIGTKL